MPQSGKKVEVQEALPPAWVLGADPLTLNPCVAALSPQTSVALFAGTGSQLWVFRQYDTPKRTAYLEPAKRTTKTALIFSFGENGWTEPPNRRPAVHEGPTASRSAHEGRNTARWKDGPEKSKLGIVEL